MDTWDFCLMEWSDWHDMLQSKKKDLIHILVVISWMNKLFTFICFFVNTVHEHILPHVFYRKGQNLP